MNYQILFLLICLNLFFVLKWILILFQRVIIKICRIKVPPKKVNDCLIQSQNLSKKKYPNKEYELKNQEKRVNESQKHFQVSHKTQLKADKNFCFYYCYEIIFNLCYRLEFLNMKKKITSSSFFNNVDNRRGKVFILFWIKI